MGPEFCRQTNADLGLGPMDQKVRPVLAKEKTNKPVLLIGVTSHANDNPQGRTSGYKDIGTQEHRESSQQGYCTRTIYTTVRRQG
jgi:hypothetical protein